MGWFHRERIGFAEFAEVNQTVLRRTAYLLCGDWHLAEDLAQTALEKVYVAWPKLERQEHPEAYAKRVLINAFLDGRRRKSSGEMTGIDADALARTPPLPMATPNCGSPSSTRCTPSNHATAPCWCCGTGRT